MVQILDEQWLSFEEAADVIRKRLGGSIGTSQAALRRAVASGDVRSFEFNDDGVVADPSRSVFWYNKNDLLYWVDQQEPQNKAKAKQTRHRHPGDAQLIEEGRQMLAAGKCSSALKAAQALAPKAEGATHEQKVERLRRLIAKARKE